MSIEHFGRITPLQGDVLSIGGIVCGVPADLVTQNDIIDNMRQARKSLCKLTGRDYGYDLERWHKHLLTDTKLREEYTFHYAWSGVLAKVKELIEDDRERLELITLAIQE